MGFSCVVFVSAVVLFGHSRAQRSDVCSLPLETGMCKAFFVSYGFDASVGHCSKFIYGGCGGNENRFSSPEECESACPSVSEEKPTQRPIPVTSVTKDPETDRCQLPLVAGFCEAYIPSFGFSDGACVEFVYGGCMGNANRFSTLEECEKACGSSAETTLEVPAETPSLCSLKPEIGPCRALFTRYAFNPQTATCDKFYYGGCGGNDNQFITVEECYKMCGGSAVKPIASTPALPTGRPVPGRIPV